MPISKTYNMDCMEAMRKIPDKYFELACVDPPYGIKCSQYGCGSRSKKYDRSNLHSWDNLVPSDDFFSEIFRVSVNQIIFGMNYYRLPPAKEFIVWDKKQPDGVSFAQAELAWTSFIGTSKIYRGSAIGQKNRIHQAQKPVALYAWIFQNYAKPGDKILDTHLGSGSSRIAAYDAGLDFIGFEIDKTYFGLEEQRFAAHLSQQSLFVKEAQYEQTTI